MARPHFPRIPDPFLVGYTCSLEALDEERKMATDRVAKVAAYLREKVPALSVSTEVLEKAPKKVISDIGEHQRTFADAAGKRWSIVVDTSPKFAALTHKEPYHVSTLVALSDPALLPFAR